MPRTPRRGSVVDGRQRAVPGRGRQAQEPAGAQRGLLQPAGREAPTPGERGDPDTRRPLSGTSQGLTSLGSFYTRAAKAPIQPASAAGLAGVPPAVTLLRV